MKTIAAAIVVLLLAVGAAAENRVEDFQDDVIGDDPAQLWYSYGETLPTGATAAVSAVGLDTTTQSLRVNKLNTQQNNKMDVRFTHDAFQPANFTMFFKLDAGGSPINELSVIFLGSVAPSVDLLFQANGGAFANVASGCGTDTLTTFPNPTSEHRLRIEWDWIGKTFDVFLDGASLMTNAAFCTNSSVDTTAILFCGITHISCAIGGGSANRRFFVDQFQYNGELPIQPEDGEVNTPSEFDSGLLAFAASFGFISRESQMLFALILVGSVTVATGAASKWVSPGRFKNYLVLSSQALLAVFCVIATFLELWMFVLALMLGIFAIRGAQEVRNTWGDVKHMIQEARQPMVVGAEGEVLSLTAAGVNEAKAREVDAALEAVETAQERDSPVQGPDDAEEGA